MKLPSKCPGSFRKQIDLILSFMALYSENAERTSKSVKNSSHATILYLEEYFFVLIPRLDVICALSEYKRVAK